MLKDNITDKLKAFVENGGTLLLTYMTGYVNENCLCYQGGFPGDGLRELAGVISEEIDTLYPSDRNGILIDQKGLHKFMEVKDYAEILRVNGAEIIGYYTDDFYKDTPAITRKRTGKGKTYYQAARCSGDDLGDFIKGLLDEAGIATKYVPYGIEYHRRTGDGAVYEFYLNLTSEDIEVANVNGIDVMTGNEIKGNVNLKNKEYLVLKLL